jgi:hypothetical protein
MTFNPTLPMRVLLFLGVCALSGTAGAQSMQGVAWPVAAGSRVRVASPAVGDRAQIGQVVLATPDSLVLEPAANGIAFRIPTSSIVKLQVSQGTHTYKAKGALYGFLIGAGTGAILGAAAYKKSDCSEICIFPDSRGFDAAVAGALLGAVGTVVGVIAGTHAVDTWVPVALPGR